MKKLFSILCAVGLSLSFNASAITIDLITNQHNLQIGNTLAVDVRISGLNNTDAPSLGTYDINFNYDANLFDVHSIIWGDATQGNQLNLMGYGSLQDSNSGSGWLNFFELSFDEAINLNSLQAGEFTLFSVMLNAIVPGNGYFSLTTNSLGDAHGNELFVDASAGINVAVGQVSVPEPSSLLLLLGVIAFIVLRAKISQPKK